MAGYVKPFAQKGLQVMPTALVLLHLSFLVINLQDDTASDFQELGRMLLGGFVAAVAIAIAFTFIRLRMRDKKPPAQFISISSVPVETERPKVSEN